MKAIIIIFGTISVYLLFVQGDALVEYEDEGYENEENEGQSAIIQGDCDSVVPNRIVFDDHIIKTRVPNRTREAAVTFLGEENWSIYCIIVDNLRPETNSTAAIVGGGIGDHYVTIDMISQPSRGFEYNITVYANATRVNNTLF